MSQHILITGCSGGGKSTLLNALAARGHQIVPEPGLRVIRQEQESGGNALPWTDLPAFLRRAARMAQDDLARMAQADGPVFYDRGLLDAAVGLRHECEVPIHEVLDPQFPYAQRVILVPPWRDCFEETENRQHSFDDAVAEYARISAALAELGCDAVVLPLVDLETRVAFVERAFAPHTNRSV